MHDGSEARASVSVPRQGAGVRAAPHPLGDLMCAFQEVAAGVEDAHRALIVRVDQLSRELESFRAQGGTPPAVACDGQSVTLETIERQAIMATLERFGGHRDRTARALGIGVRTLGMKLRQWKAAGLVPDHA